MVSDHMNHAEVEPVFYPATAATMGTGRPASRAACSMASLHSTGFMPTVINEAISHKHIHEKRMPRTSSVGDDLGPVGQDLLHQRFPHELDELIHMTSPNLPYHAPRAVKKADT